MARGFLYLVAVMDWVSHYVLAWRLSNLLDDLLHRGPRESIE
jgi:putative transposase